MSYYLQELERTLGPGRETGTGELNFNCPYCLKRTGRPDTKYHFFINPTRRIHGITGWYYCQRCKATGPFARIYKGKDHSSEDLTRWTKVVKEFRYGKPPTKKSSKLTPPEDLAPIIPGTSAYDYLRNRGLDDDTITYYRIGYGTQSLADMTKEQRKKYAGSGRIVFPDFDDDGDMCYWVARTYRNHKIKYKNPPGRDARDQLYNLSKAKQYKDVIITEGVMSAIAAGRNAIATYGKDVTRTQVSILAAAGFSTYYVALDGDALVKEKTSKQMYAPAYRLANELYSRNCRVKVVRLPYEHDPASVRNFRSYVESAALWDFKESAMIIMNYK